MKKIYAAIAMMMLALTPAIGKTIDPATAALVAQNFWQQEYGSRTTFADLSQQLGLHEIYVFEAAGGKGFVIVSGDDVALPVLGHSNKGGFPVERIAPHVMSWLRSYEIEIAYAKQHNVLPAYEVEDEWAALIEGKPLPQAKAPVVDALMSTVWDQSNPYNKLCPQAEGERKAPTGCVATAMAMVMKYWNFPEHGIGTHEYNYNNCPDSIVHWPYGTLGADFEHTTYDWEHMPDTLKASSDSAAIAAVSTLMYHCGVALDMVYGKDGSMAFVTKEDAILFDTTYYPARIAAEVVIPQYFGYSPITDGKLRKDFTLSDWIAMLQNELVQGRPVIYAGAEEEGPSAGHCFVIDGCDKRQRFHINFGWGGNCDAMYYVDAINPREGYYEYDFNSRQQGIFGMCPPGMEKIETVQAEVKALVWSHDRTIEISSDRPMKGEVYDIMGRMETRFEADANVRIPIHASHGGIYIVRIGNTAHKVYVK